MKKHGLLFSTVFGIGQLIVKTNPSDPDCCYYLHCPTFNYTVTPDTTNDRLNAIDYTQTYLTNPELVKDVKLTLSATFPNLQQPENIVKNLDNLTGDFPDAFQWAGEINVFKHALVGNGFFKGGKRSVRGSIELSFFISFPFSSVSLPSPPLSLHIYPLSVEFTPHPCNT